MALPRIAIIGGGVGSVTAAIQLSKEGWQQRFSSITLYQQGWRLGGKGASGRGSGLRIEEHGLHIWFGFYENAFRMLHRCHEELDLRAQAGEPRWPLPFQNMEESFRACTEISLTDHDGCGWKLWDADFFEFDDDRPWIEPDPRPPGERPDDWSVVFYAARCLHLAADLAVSLVRSEPGLEIVAEATHEAHEEAAGVEDAAALLWAALGGDVQGVLSAAAQTLDALTAEAVEQPLLLEVLEVIVRALDLVLDFLRGRYDELVRAHDSVRRAWYVVDLMIAIVRGLIEDDVIRDGFDVVNDIDFREWLLDHGADRDSVDCALVRTIIYDLAFAYRGGDPQRPAAEAGTALRGLLRTFFTYRGALMWKMNAGMGDVVFAPLYELLVKRGVDVRFFNRVEAVRTSAGRIEEIEIDIQADVPATTTPKSYLQPPASATKPAKPVAVWPSAPGHILAGGAKTAAKVEPEVYESWYAGRAAAKVDTKVLRYGDPGEGFELVMFGLPISCVPKIAPDLPANSPRWSGAVGALETVPTQAMQLWLNQPVSGLCDAQPGVVAGGFVEPFDTWADMFHLTAQEYVAGAATVAYLCNVLADSPSPARGKADAWLASRAQLVKVQALRFLNHDVASLWPRATNPITREFDWGLLVDPSGATGEARLDAQYLRANVEPSERYVLSVPGSSAHRIPPDDTGFSNLYAAGDWTSCVLNAGCVEAAVISGLLAANGIFRSIGDDAAQEAIIGVEGP
jgi:uncharacterized protein with NAD-binding domain and iron-sulfur cluster